MKGNRGKTSLKSKHRASNPMGDFDRLPRELRAWVTQADLPWRAKSVLKSYQRADSVSGDGKKALEELDRLQDRLVSKDAKSVWGEAHPHANDRVDA